VELTVNFASPIKPRAVGLGTFFSCRRLNQSQSIGGGIFFSRRLFLLDWRSNQTFLKFKP
jgi:hypothetical protein